MNLSLSVAAEAIVYDNANTAAKTKILNETNMFFLIFVLLKKFFIILTPSSLNFKITKVHIYLPGSRN